MSEDSNNQHFYEPVPYYGSTRKLKIFNSIEEAEEDDISWLASLTPEEHLQNAMLLIRQTYAHILKDKPTLGNRIHFD